MFLGNEEILVIQVLEDEIEGDSGDETDDGWTGKHPDDIWILNCVGAGESDSGRDGGCEEVEGGDETFLFGELVVWFD